MSTPRQEEVGRAGSRVGEREREWELCLIEWRLLAPDGWRQWGELQQGALQCLWAYGVWRHTTKCSSQLKLFNLPTAIRKNTAGKRRQLLLLEGVVKSTAKLENFIKGELKKEKQQHLIIQHLIIVCLFLFLFLTAAARGPRAPKVATFVSQACLLSTSQRALHSHSTCCSRPLSQVEFSPAQVG